jgi:transcriptional regulator with XRE-family HTH domain
LRGIELGSLLKNYRTEKRMTQEKLAEVLECSPSTISRIEKGDNIPNRRIYENAIRYAKLVDDHQMIKNENETSLFGLKGNGGLLEALECRKWEQFEEKLCALKNQADSDHRLRQLYEMSRMIWEILYVQKITGSFKYNENRIDEFEERLLDTIGYTFPEFPKVKAKSDKKYTHTEIILLNGYAFISFRKGKKEEAVDILRTLSGSLQISLNDNTEYYKAEAALYNNKAVMAMRMGKHVIAEDFLNRGVNIAKHHGSMYILISLLKNQTKNFIEVGNEKRAVDKRMAYQSIARTVSEEDDDILMQETEEGTVILVF